MQESMRHIKAYGQFNEGRLLGGKKYGKVADAWKGAVKELFTRDVDWGDPKAVVSVFRDCNELFSAKATLSQAMDQMTRDRPDTQSLRTASLIDPGCGYPYLHTAYNGILRQMYLSGSAESIRALIDEASGVPSSVYIDGYYHDWPPWRLAPPTFFDMSGRTDLGQRFLMTLIDACTSGWESSLPSEERRGWFCDTGSKDLQLRLANHRSPIALYLRMAVERDVYLNLFPTNWIRSLKPKSWGVPLLEGMCVWYTVLSGASAISRSSPLPPRWRGLTPAQDLDRIVNNTDVGGLAAALRELCPEPTTAGTAIQGLLERLVAQNKEEADPALQKMIAVALCRLLSWGVITYSGGRAFPADFADGLEPDAMASAIRQATDDPGVLLASLKRLVAAHRRSPTRLMTAARRAFPKEYDAAFPGDTEWELGDLGM